MGSVEELSYPGKILGQRNLAIGDVVRLTAGGPMMTVTEILSPKDPEPYQLSWFDGSILHRDYFNSEALVYHPEDNPTE